MKTYSTVYLIHMAENGEAGYVKYSPILGLTANPDHAIAFQELGFAVRTSINLMEDLGTSSCAVVECSKTHDGQQSTVEPFSFRVAAHVFSRRKKTPHEEGLKVTEEIE